jgi:hypothetical protein
LVLAVKGPLIEAANNYKGILTNSFAKSYQKGFEKEKSCCLTPDSYRLMNGNDNGDECTLSVILRYKPTQILTTSLERIFSQP